MSTMAQKHIEAAAIAQRIRAMHTITLQRRIVGLLEAIEDEHAMAPEDPFYMGRVAAMCHALEMLSDADVKRPT